MKILSIKLFALMAFLLIGGNACAYTWGFSNHTNKTIDLKLGLMGWGDWFNGSVAPGQRFEFAMGGWFAGYCFHSFLWIDAAANAPDLTPEMIQNFIKVGTNPSFLVATGKIKKPIPLRNINQWKEGSIIFLPNELYDKTVKNAGKIGTGIDEFFCNTFWAVKVISAAAKSECPSVFGALIEWIGGLIARGACRSREIEIIEDGNKNIEFISVVD